MPDSAVSQSSARETVSPYRRRLAIGAEPIEGGLTHVRVWAPRVDRVHVVTSSGAPAPLDAEPDGYFSGRIKAVAGDRYQFKLGDDEQLYPDPASRFQPDGPHGSSQIVDPHAFGWTDAAWSGVTIDGQIVYEMHVGTFTTGGRLRRRRPSCESWRASGSR